MKNDLLKRHKESRFNELLYHFDKAKYKKQGKNKCFTTGIVFAK